MAVIEDKSQDSPVKKSSIEAQLIAEAIATYQSNSNKKRDVLGEEKHQNEMPILGVRVKGMVFTFILSLFLLVLFRQLWRKNRLVSLRK